MTYTPSILTLTMNPAVGLYTTVETMITSSKMRCAAAERDPGGGGINVARATHRFGANARAVFPAGGAMGSVLSELLAAEKVPHIAVPVSGETRENLTIFETSTGHEYRFVLEGPALSQSEMEACLTALERAQSCDVLVASGSLPPGVPNDFFRLLVPIARKLRAKLVIDSSGAALQGALGPGVYMLKPSLREMEMLVAKKLPTMPERLAAARALITAGAAELVALTLGAQGALLVSADEAWHAIAPKVDVISTVGSGDSFLAAAIVAVSEGAPLSQVCARGVAGGTAALSAPGTKLCQPEQVDVLIERITVSAVA